MKKSRLQLKPVASLLVIVKQLSKIQNYFKNFRFYTIVFSFSLLAFGLAVPVFAAVLYLEPDGGEYQPGDIFVVEMKIDNENEYINTVEANLSFSQDILQVVDFSKGSSILTLWVREPEIDQESGLISFAGGIPGGYGGKIPGDPGVSNLLGKIIFKVKDFTEDDFLQIDRIDFLESSQVLLNDSKGTSAKLETKGITFEITQFKPMQIPKSEWQEQLSEDKISPEPFIIEVRKNKALFGGKYFLIFSTVDKHTGLDYFVVSESREGEEDWREGESPYLLEDQELQSIIKVKAVDKAGNERIVEIIPPKPLVSEEKKTSSWWILILIILIIFIIFWIFKKLKRKKRRPFHRTSLS